MKGFWKQWEIPLSRTGHLTSAEQTRQTAYELKAIPRTGFLGRRLTLMSVFSPLT